MASIRNYTVRRNVNTGKFRIVFEHNTNAQDGGWRQSTVIVPDDLPKLGRSIVESLMLEVAKQVAEADGALHHKRRPRENDDVLRPQDR